MKSCYKPDTSAPASMNVMIFEPMPKSEYLSSQVVAWMLCQNKNKLGKALESLHASKKVAVPLKEVQPIVSSEDGYHLC